MPLFTNKKATARTPQVVTLVIDNGRTMQEVVRGNMSKAEVVTESIRDLVITTQALSQGSRGFRYLLNIAKFGDGVMSLAEAENPENVNLGQLVVRGDSNSTNMESALDWAYETMQLALDKCRAIPAYDALSSPEPLVIVLSDGENIGAEIEEGAQKLRSIEFQGGTINVVACGIDVKHENSDALESVTSDPKSGTNFGPLQLAELIAKVGATMRGPFKDRALAQERIYSSEAPVTLEDGSTVVRIFYATDRQQRREKSSFVKYGAARSAGTELRFGDCHIRIPARHKKGRLESPSLLRFEFRPNPDRHIVLLAVQTLEEHEFLQRVIKAVAESPAKEALIFVHGYNVTFEDAVRRTGQIAFDLHFVGAPILYSWPASGHVLDYLSDEASAIWTAPHLERFLCLIAQHSGAQRIHIIAHSMGNRAVCDALKALSHRELKNANVILNHLVLAAPDIDADTFRELAAALKNLSRRITLYASSKDKAIRISQMLHKNPRAGALPLVIVPGIESIDASEMGTDFFLHSYFSDNWPLLSDIYSLLSDDKPAASRFGLRESRTADGTYYIFSA
jgi:esterase/lipase superfamily enzyme/uncharacterized protein YegL